MSTVLASPEIVLDQDKTDTVEFKNWKAKQLHYLKSDCGYENFTVIHDEEEYFTVIAYRNGERNKIHVSEEGCYLIRATIPA